jgi:hypothetical protein
MSQQTLYNDLAVSGNIYASGNIFAKNIIYTSGNQTITGTTNFTQPSVFEDHLFFSSQPTYQLSELPLTTASGIYTDSFFLGKTKFSQNNSVLIDGSFGSSWTARDVNRQWQSISMSSDGKHQTAGAGNIHTSNDFGKTWRNLDTIVAQICAMSSDGQYQSAVSASKLYVSQDYGSTWTEKTISGRGGDRYTDISISSDGKYQVLLDNRLDLVQSFIYISKDYGDSWQLSTTGGTSLTNVSISSDGKYIVAVRAPGSPMISRNYGQTWGVISLSSALSWVSVAISANGKYITLTESNKIYVSFDNGFSFQQKIIGSSTFYNIVMNGNGKYQVVHSSDKLFVSTNYGLSWSEKVITGSSGYFNGIAISDNGKYITVIFGFGRIYTSETDEYIQGSLYSDNIYANTNAYISGTAFLNTISSQVINTGTASNISIIGSMGSGAREGGRVNIAGGNSILGSPGSVIISGGSVSGHVPAQGGSVRILAGTGSSPGDIYLTAGTPGQRKGDITLDGDIIINPHVGGGIKQIPSSITIYKTGAFGFPSDILIINQSNAVMNLKNGITISGVVSGNALTGSFNSLFIKQFTGASAQNGNPGQIAYSGNNLYLCTGQNLWGRVAVTNF